MTPTTTAVPLHVRVLGPLEIDAGDRPVTLTSSRQRALLSALVMQANEAVSVERLATAVWAERPPQVTARAMHTLIARLRKALGGAAQRLATHPAGYMLVIDRHAIDAGAFETAHEAARSRMDSDPVTAARLVDDALGLWRGAAYDEFADRFARAEAARLEQVRLTALEDRAALAIRLGASETAVAHAGSLVADHPLRERPVELLMRALHAAGRTSDALAAYRRHRSLVADELGLDPSPALRDLEARILRDEMPRSPDPPTTVRQRAQPSPATHALPCRPSPLVDRSDELGLLRRSVAPGHVTTLTGPGGVGKTRLALEFAHAGEADGEQVWWADLVAVGPGRLVDALAEATGIELAPGEEPGVALCDALGARRGLLCLDNAEHLLAALAPLVERLRAVAPHLAVLTTSRERLAIDAETVIVLAPLPLPSGPDRDNPAVRLFLERSPTLRDGELTAAHLEQIAGLCRRLDGLPLAIELAAAQAAMLGLPQVTERLGQRLDLLAGGRRTGSARHRTLRAVVDSSHDLLSANEARLLARLAVFPGAFTLDQVESICADDQIPGAVAVLLVARLVEQSLVQSDGDRFWLLETIHRYARERLDAAGETATLRARHAYDAADRLTHLTPQLWTAQEAAAVRDLAALVTDLHAAWEYASAHDRPLAVRLAAGIFDYAYFRQRLDLLDWATPVATWKLEHPELPRALATAAASAWISGRLEDARRHTARAVAVAGGDDQPAAATAFDVMADLAMFENRTDDAVARYRTSAALFHADGAHVRGLCTEIGAAHALAYAGRTEEFEHTMADLLPRALQAANPTTLALAYFVIGEAFCDTDLDLAAAAYTAAIDHGGAADSRLLMAAAHSARVALTARAGPPAQALDQLGDVLEQYAGLGHRSAAWRALGRAVPLLARLGADHDAAVLAGAVRAVDDRYPLLEPDRGQFDRALDAVRGRLGDTATRRALTMGTALSYGDTLARARQAFRAALPAAASLDDDHAVPAPRWIRRGADHDVAGVHRDGHAGSSAVALPTPEPPSSART